MTAMRPIGRIAGGLALAAAAPLLIPPAFAGGRLQYVGQGPPAVELR